MEVTLSWKSNRTKSFDRGNAFIDLFRVCLDADFQSLGTDDRRRDLSAPFCLEFQYQLLGAMDHTHEFAFASFWQEILDAEWSVIHTS
ncbi:hypothetical protein Tco_1409063 [Tanacetum coccineum]